MRLDDFEKQFEQVDKRFEQVLSKIDHNLYWTIGLLVPLILAVVGAMLNITFK